MEGIENGKETEDGSLIQEQTSLRKAVQEQDPAVLMAQANETLSDFLFNKLNLVERLESIIFNDVTLASPQLTIQVLQVLVSILKRGGGEGTDGQDPVALLGKSKILECV